MGSNTPLMNQYLSIKKNYPDCLLFFRLGDFYELFGEDAVKAAKELDIVLTSRGVGKDAKVPMCGVPYHAAENYLNRLLEKGYKVAICEQLEEAKPGKGIVKRDVVRVATPGTVLNPAYLDQSNNNYILSLYQKKDNIGCAWSDISTGEFQIAQFSDAEGTEYLVDLVNRLQPTECIVAKGQLAVFQSLLKDRWDKQVLYTEVDQAAEDLLLEQFGQENMVGLNQNAMKEGLAAAANLLVYLQGTQKTDKLPFRKLEVYTPGSHMYLDAMTIRNLELFITLRDGKKEGSLLWALDRTLTGMGTRLLRRWLGMPLLNVAEIEERQESVQELAENYFLRKDVRDQLDKVYDLERIISRIDWLAANPRDLLALANSLSVIPHLKESLTKANSKLLQKLGKMLDPISELQQLIFRALVDDPPVNPKNGGVIKSGYNSEIDRLREMIDQGEDWIKKLEQEERKRTGIKSLKIGFNKVFGYYIEVTKPNLHLVPDNYIRKQTLTQGERFFTQELKEQEANFLGATERLQELEYQLFLEILEQTQAVAERVRKNAQLIAQIDCLASFAETAARYNYVRPKINNSGIISIKNGRHPVLEQLMPEGSFVPNSMHIGDEDNRIHILTGPNMAGKSTYMRQMAELILMAQCGSLIPAEEAEIGIAERIFVRAGALDDLGKGQSTFMMEMNEVSYILQHATKDSFIVLDEVGRGTGTFDGLGIAWAIVEYLHDHIKPRVIFATHYHQLTQLADKLKGVVNYSVAVAEKGTDIVFLHRIVPGGTDKSYGIQVARLANLPAEVVERAREIAESLEAKAKGELKEKKKTTVTQPVQLVLFDERSTIIQELRSLNLVQTTPLEALNILSQWQQRLMKENTSSKPKGHQKR